MHAKKKCKACNTVKIKNRKQTSFKSHTTSKEYQIKKLITCATTHVTYLITCPCGLQYVGRTTRKLSIRIGEHLNNIKKGFKKHSLSMHFRIYHNRDPTLAQFCGIDTVESHWRGGNRKIAISKNETFWICELDTIQPKGMNKDLDINCFISNY